MKNKIELPPFYNYKEEGTDSGYESIQDFILSWTLRCSVENYSKVNNTLQSYSKGVLLALIFGDNDSDWNYQLAASNSEIIVKSVKTKRQWNLIDLLAEINLEINGENKSYILSIENKWYSSIREGQLEKSIKFIRDEYSYFNNKIINLIVFSDYEKLNLYTKEFCKKAGYKVVVIEDLYELAKMRKDKLTNNYLFDEYWFRF
ncbi:PD-(D/E)XK nuclease family protein [Confluentibacter flavum]|uniref:Uncharacterized protein n=1 Tax=Confluentibacter flavum TaxID=1909700 RepID=A0A2N3HMB9_9FLAO|nr:PD-(D/E)XK nuclease family protein [Confluentibacter flavum]PKQ46081.1 hypothetical protein CSW08_04890 [Confluentibacter flavum]